MALTASERIIADKLEEMVRNGIEASQKLVEAYQKLSHVDWGFVVQDKTTGDIIVEQLPGLEKMIVQYNTGSLALLMIEILAKPRAAKEA